MRSRSSSRATCPRVCPGPRSHRASRPDCRVDGTVWLGLGAGIAAAQLVLRLVGIEAHVPSEKPHVASRDDHLRLRRFSFSSSSEPTWSPWTWVRRRRRSAPRLPRRGDDLARGATDYRVDQRQAVVLAHEVGVHHPEPADPIHASHGGQATGRGPRLWVQRPGRGACAKPRAAAEAGGPPNTTLQVP